MKKLFLIMLTVLFAITSNGKNINENPKKIYGVELGTFNGFRFKYNPTKNFSVGTRAGMQYTLGYTVPYGFYPQNGLAPTLDIFGNWYFCRFKRFDNQGLYAAIGLFADLGKYAPLEFIAPQGQCLYSASAYLKIGGEFPIVKCLSVNFSASSILGVGLRGDFYQPIGSTRIWPAKRRPESSYPYENLVPRSEFMFELSLIYSF